jgi:hypothetical protein
MRMSRRQPTECARGVVLRGKYCWISRHGAGSSMYPAGIVPRDCGRNTHSARRAACEICQSTRRHRHYRGVCWCVVTLMPRNAGRRRKLSVRDGARRTSRSSECLDSPALGPLNENDRFAKWAFPPTLPRVYGCSTVETSGRQLPLLFS